MAETTTDSTKTLKPMTSWLGGFGIYKYSKAAVLLCLGTLVILWLISIVANGVVGAIFNGNNSSAGLMLIGRLATLFIGSLVGVAFVHTVLSAVRGKRVEVGDALSVGLSLWVKAILLNLLVGITVGVAFLLLIIPGLIVWPRLVLAQYFLVDQKLGVMDSFKASWNATQGHSAKVWGILGVGILMVIPSITIIGILLTIYWLVLYSASLAVLYTFLAKKTAATK
jgi:hypothetical protein